MNQDATIRQRQIAHEMRQLRATMTAAEVHEATGITPSKLSRIESAHVRLQDDDLRKLAALYHVGDLQTQRLLALAQDARNSSIMKSFVGFEWAAALRGHLELEADASRIESFTVDLVPGLLQHPSYTRALIADRPDVEDDQIESRLTFRAKRQERLNAGRLEMWSILDEGILYREVGGAPGLADQLEKLVESPKNVTVQVIPWSAGAHAALGSPFQLFKFPKYPTIVYQETIKHGLYEDDESLVEEHVKFMEAVRAEALSPRASRELMTKRLNDLRNR
jgi:transcriptional regulator with XRE-family HTH domain